MTKEPLQRYFHVIPNMIWGGPGPRCARCKKLIKDNEWDTIIHDMNEASQYHEYCWDYLMKGVRWKVTDNTFDIINPDYIFKLEEDIHGEGTMLNMSGDASKKSGTTGLPNTDRGSLPKLGRDTTWTSWRYRCIQRIRKRIGKSRN